MGNWVKTKRIDLNPSSADRWMTCTASPQFIFDNWERLPVENRAFADEGNTAHEVAASLLQGRKVNPKECPVPVTPEINWHGWNYMEFVESQLDPGGKLFVEQKLPLFYAENRNAVVDAAVVNSDSLHIVDYKYGEGIIVSPENNLQAIIYAKSVIWNWSKLGFAGKEIGNGKSWDFDKPDDFPIFISIYQPRTRDGELYHTWETTLWEIRKAAKKIFDTAQTILYHNDSINHTVDFAPSDKACQWCPAKGFCEARQKELTKNLEPLADFDKPPITFNPGVVTEQQLAAVVRHGDQIKKWVDDAQAFALAHMRAGNVIPGFKLVMSRGGNRFWTDPNKAAKYLEQDTILRKEELFSEPKLVGPAAVEKLLGKGKFPARVYSLISKPPGNTIIVPEDDTRESALIDGAKEFTDLEAEQINLDQF